MNMGAWYKSSYSTGGNANCLEVCWHKSSYSSPHGDNCLEVAELETQTAVRDSQHPHLGHLTFPAAEWRAFLHDVRTGRH